jgi:peptide subunit release factor RF-3
VTDIEGRPVLLFENDWYLRRTEEENPKVKFISAVQPGRSGRRAA